MLRRGVLCFTGAPELHVGGARGHGRATSDEDTTPDDIWYSPKGTRMPL